MSNHWREKTSSIFWKCSKNSTSICSKNYQHVFHCQKYWHYLSCFWLFFSKYLFFGVLVLAHWSIWANHVVFKRNENMLVIFGTNRCWIFGIFSKNWWCFFSWMVGHLFKIPTRINSFCIYLHIYNKHLSYFALS